MIKNTYVLNISTPVSYLRNYVYENLIFQGCSIYPQVESLRGLSEDLKGQIVLESRPSPIEAIFGRVASANRAKKKLKKLTNETKV